MAIYITLPSVSDKTSEELYNNVEVALKLCKSLVLPDIDYGDIIDMCATRQTLNRLQLLNQNMARQVILKVDNDIVDGKHYEQGLLKHQA